MRPKVRSIRVSDIDYVPILNAKCAVILNVFVCFERVPEGERGIADTTWPSL